MRIHVCFLCGEKCLFLNQERVWVVEDCFCFRKKVCFFLFCSYVFNRLLTWPTDQPRYASYKSYIMSNPWHPQIYLVHEQDRTEHPHVLSHSHRACKVTFLALAFYLAYDPQGVAYDLLAYDLLAYGSPDVYHVDDHQISFSFLRQLLFSLQG